MIVRLALALALTGGGVASAAVTNDIMGMLREHVDRADRLFLRVLPVEAYGRSRQALATPVPYAVELPVTIPAHGRLRLGIAGRDTFFREDLTTQADPIRFTVTITPSAGGPVVVADRTVSLRNAADRRWIDLEVDLARFAGPATLRLAAETPGTPKMPEKTFALWSRPVLHDPTAERSQPNLLFVTIDALRADHVGSYGYDRPTTPALDRLATEGIRFTRAFTNAPMTVPSLPQIFTSRYFPTSASPTLVSSLFAAGFPHTKAIVHNPYLEYFLQLDARDGFDSVNGVQWRADRIAAKGLRWIETRGDERWALYLHFLDVHTPYRVRPPDGARFVDPAYHGPVGYGFGDVEGARQGKYDDADRAAIVARYDSALRYVDDHLGALLEALRAKGLLDRTLVVVSADHGEELWDHGGFFHGVSLYDEQLHVPLIVRLPRAARAGTVVERTVRAIDIAPTIADALGAPTFPEFEGESLLPAIADPAGAADREVFARAANMVYPLRLAVRTPSHKLIHTIEPFAEELYDLVADPKERRNLAGDPASAPALEDMRARLARHRAPLARSGFQVRAVAAAGASAHVEVTVTSNDNQMLANPDRAGDDREGSLVLARDGLSLAWRRRVGAEPAGFRFDRALRLHDDGGLTIRVRADGRDLPPEAIVVGPPEAHPDASPFVYKVAGPRGTKAVEQPVLVVAEPPVPTAASLPLRVYLWRSLDAAPATTTATPTDEATKARLRALGYVE